MPPKKIHNPINQSSNQCYPTIIIFHFFYFCFINFVLNWTKLKGISFLHLYTLTKIIFDKYLVSKYKPQMFYFFYCWSAEYRTLKISYPTAVRFVCFLITVSNILLLEMYLNIRNVRFCFLFVFRYWEFLKKYWPLLAFKNNPKSVFGRIIGTPFKNNIIVL